MRSFGSGDVRVQVAGIGTIAGPPARALSCSAGIVRANEVLRRAERVRIELNMSIEAEKICGMSIYDCRVQE